MNDFFTMGSDPIVFPIVFPWMSSPGGAVSLPLGVTPSYP